MKTPAKSMLLSTASSHEPVPKALNTRGTNSAQWRSGVESAGVVELGSRKEELERGQGIGDRKGNCGNWGGVGTDFNLKFPER